MKRQRAYAHLLAVAATLFAAGHASAQTPEAVPAPAAKAPPIAAPAVVRLLPTVQLAGQTLHLNGKGTRYRAVVRVYDIACTLRPRSARWSNWPPRLGPSACS